MSNDMMEKKTERIFGSVSLRIAFTAGNEIIEAFKNGSRYRKIEEDHRKIENGYRREIKNLHKQLAAAKAATTNGSSSPSIRRKPLYR